MKFWDASALIPLLLTEPSSAARETIYAADPEKLIAQWRQRWPFPDLQLKSERWVEPDMEDVFTAYSQRYDAVLKDRHQ